MSELEKARQIDRLCDEFERECQSGNSPDIDGYLGRITATHRAALFRELLSLELDYLQESPDIDRYRRRWSAYESIVSEVLAGKFEAKGTSDLIGRYQVLGRMATGGQAEVYLAMDPNLGRQVAIKLGRKPDPGSAHRITQEGELLASLKHPNIARVHDLDFYQNRPYLVMELIEGVNLREYAAKHNFDPASATLLVSRLARAVAYAHRYGVIHHDIKPENVVVDDKGKPYLIDFGLANLFQQGNHTKPGVAGTPCFMAPEQARADASQIGPATDIFGLGAVLYFLLCKVGPFQAEDSVESLVRSRHGQIDERALDHKSVPRALQRVCKKAMALHPEERFHSASQMAAALDNFIDAPRRRRSLFVAAVAMLVICLAAFSLWWLNAPEGPNGHEKSLAYAFDLNGQHSKYLVTVKNASLSREDGPTYFAQYWHPQKPGHWGEVVYRFPTRQPTVQAMLIAKINVFTETTLGPPFDDNAEARLEVSPDNQRWTTVAVLPRDLRLDFSGPVDITHIVKGSCDIYVRARLKCSKTDGGDGPIFAQFLRCSGSLAEQPKPFSLQVTTCSVEH